MREGMSKRSLDPCDHSQDMAEVAGRLQRAVRTTGLSPETAGVVLRDVESALDWMGAIVVITNQISDAWHGGREIRRDSLDSFTANLSELGDAIEKAQKAAYAAAFDLRPELDIDGRDGTQPTPPAPLKSVAPPSKGTSSDTA